MTKNLTSGGFEYTDPFYVHFNMIRSYGAGIFPPTFALAWNRARRKLFCHAQ